MYVVYYSSSEIEALTVSDRFAALLAGKERILKWISWDDYVKNDDLCANEKFNESAFVLHDTQSPSCVQAIVQHPEMVLDLILNCNNEDGNKGYEWRIETIRNGLALYIRPHNGDYWKLMTAVSDEGTCRKTMEELTQMFFLYSEWPLTGCKLSEYIRNYNASLPKDKLHRWVPDYKASSMLVLFNRDEESQSPPFEELSV